MVRVCESLSKLHEYISPSELKLPSSTLSLEEDLKVNSAYQLLCFAGFILELNKRGGRGSKLHAPLIDTPGSCSHSVAVPVSVCFAHCKILRHVANFVTISPGFASAPWISCQPPHLLQFLVDFPPPFLLGYYPPPHSGLHGLKACLVEFHTIK